jgi:phosphohistidine swiveling domain-containing protein
MSQEVADPQGSTGDQHELRGCGASPGVYEGRARVVNGDGGFEHIEAGDILIATMTTPAYNVVVPLLGAVVTDTGGMLCHAAIVAREFAIPPLSEREPPPPMSPTAPTSASMATRAPSHSFDPSSPRRHRSRRRRPALLTLARDPQRDSPLPCLTGST